MGSTGFVRQSRLEKMADMPLILERERKGKERADMPLILYTHKCAIFNHGDLVDKLYQHFSETPSHLQL